MMGRNAILAVLTYGTCIAAAAISSPAAAQVKPFNIPPGDMKSAVDTFARQSGRQIVYRADHLRSARTGGVTGQMEPDAALDTLLRGSGLEAKQDRTGAIAIVPAQNRPKSGDAMAQGRHATTADGPAVKSASEDPAGDVADSMGDIVVTAQKRSETMREVPAVLLSKDAESLFSAGVRSPTDLTTAFPGLTYSNSNASAQPAIRGVTTNAASNSETPVAVYIDGIYQPGQAMTNAYDLSNVSHIEVLKGPQGTIFGRNVVAGAILISTRDPDLARATSKVQLTASTFGGGTSTSAFNHSESAFVSAPLIADKLAVSLSTSYTNRGGFIRNIAPGLGDRKLGKAEKTAVQGKILWQPNDFVRVLLNARYYNEDANIGATIRDRVSVNLTYPDGVVGSQPWQTGENTKSFSEVTTQSYSLRAEFNTEIGRFTSLTAYQKMENPQTSDTDGGYSLMCQAAGRCLSLDFRYDLPEIVSQEIDFSSVKFGSFSFVAGMFAFSKSSDLPVFINKSKLIYHQRGVARSSAGFGEATFDVTDRLSLIAGVRYNYDKEYEQGTNIAALPYTPKHHQDWSAVTKRFVAKYRPSDTLNLYASFSQGYQAGFLVTRAFNNASGATFNPLAPINPQYLDAYEIGAKFNVPGVTFNLSAFRYDYSNIVVQRFDGTTIRFANAAAARLTGVDSDWNIRVIDGLTITGGVSWLPETKFTNFPNAVITVKTGNTGSVVIADLTGDRLIRSPKITASLGLNFETHVGSDKLTLNGTFYHSSAYKTQLGNENNQGAYSTLGLLASFTPNDGPLTLTAFARNLTNEAYVTGTAASGSAYLDYYAPPREVGLSASYSF